MTGAGPLNDGFVGRFRLPATVPCAHRLVAHRDRCRAHEQRGFRKAKRFEIARKLLQVARNVPGLSSIIPLQL